MTFHFAIRTENQNTQCWNPRKSILHLKIHRIFIHLNIHRIYFTWKSKWSSVALNTHVTKAKHNIEDSSWQNPTFLSIYIIFKTISSFGCGQQCVDTLLYLQWHAYYGLEILKISKCLCHQVTPEYKQLTLWLITKRSREPLRSYNSRPNNH